MNDEFSVVLVDDHSVVRQGMSLMLKKYFPAITVFQASEFNELIDILKREKIIDLILLDINMHGGNTTEMITQIKNIQENLRILIFSAYEEKHYALRYIQAGANGYLNKLEEEEEIIKAVKEVLTTGKYVSSVLRESMLNNLFNNGLVNPLDILSEREFEIANLLVRGEGNLEIANKLNIHVSTVSTYKSRIYSKLNVDNVVSLSDIFKIYYD